MENKPYLLMRSPTGNQTFFLSEGNCWTLGRNNDNKIVIPSRWISRNHAMLQSTDKEIYLIDLGSRNGTFVNGRRVNIPIKLKHRDVVTFGQTDLEFVDPLEELKLCPVLTENDLTEEKEDTTSFLHVRRLMSVMVVDIRNFTVLSRKLDETHLSSLIGTWCRQSGTIIRQYGSWVDKYIGDAVMAIWFHGQQTVTPQEIKNIFRAVHSLNQMTQELNHRYILPFDLQIGVGINTGYAMVGNAGTGERPDYTAIGDTVNAAFRLESATKTIKLDIALGETTYTYLSCVNQIQSIFQEQIVELKGYENPTLAYGANFTSLEQTLLS